MTVIPVNVGLTLPTITHNSGTKKVAIMGQTAAVAANATLK